MGTLLFNLSIGDIFEFNENGNRYQVTGKDGRFVYIRNIVTGMLQREEKNWQVYLL